MTNLNKLFKNYSVDSDKQREAVKDLLKNHLPKEYTTEIAKRLNRDVTAALSQKIRNVKSGIQKDVEIFNAILEVALENKEKGTKLTDTLKKVG